MKSDFDWRRQRKNTGTLQASCIMENFLKKDNNINACAMIHGLTQDGIRKTPIQTPEREIDWR
jgi:hypothetical protein